MITYIVCVWKPELIINIITTYLVLFFYCVVCFLVLTAVFMYLSSMRYCCAASSAK